MAITTKAPGVYIEEISTLPASIVQVKTAVPAFIGYTESDPGEPVKITSMAEFAANFSDPTKAYTDGADIDAVTVTMLTTSTASVAFNATRFRLYHALRSYFANGGGECYVISAGVYGSPVDTELTAKLSDLELEDEPTLIVIPDIEALSANKGNVYTAVLAQCASLQDRFAIFDVAGGDDTSFRSDVGTLNLKYGAAYTPYINSSVGISDTEVTLADSSGSFGDIAGKTLAQAISLAESGDTAVAAELNIALGIIRDAIATLDNIIPPSGAVAGVYCSTDRSRGVWKAPANVSLRSVIEPDTVFTQTQLEALNVDTDGKSINAIRSFTGKGTLVYGARTLAGNDAEWRYVPVRRLYIMAEESIKKATEFVVFEPNDANTWLRVRTMIENFLRGLWRDGALAGATPQEAFFVNVGLGSSMTQQDILDGKLIIEVGMAAVRPAEFIVLKFSHKLQES